MSALQIPTAEVFLPLLQPSRYKGAYGGRGSAKSHFFAENLVDRLVEDPTIRAVCVREKQNTLRESSKRIIESKIQKFNLGSYFQVFESEIRTPQGGLVIFNGMQSHNAESIKSLEGFRIMWADEAQALSPRSLEYLRPTLRNDAELWFSWNPRKPTDPIDKLLCGSDLPPRSIVVQANFKDNPWFPQDLREEMEFDRRRDPDKYRHIWLGEYESRSDARVFNNWRIDTIEIPKHARPYFGADWGFSIDPSVLVRCWIWGRNIYVDREVVLVGCEIDRTPALFDRINDSLVKNVREWPIIADSARPETISYMQRHGYPKIESSRKGPNSVNDGVEFLKSYDIVVHPECRHTSDELSLYSYKVDKQTDDVLPEFEDDHNHVIDALRYAVEKLRRAPVIAYSLPFSASASRGVPG